MAKIKKPTFKIILYTYKNLSDGTHPVMIRVTYDRKQKYFSLGVSASPQTWSAELSRVHNQGKRLTDKQKLSNCQLDRHSGKLEKTLKHFEDVDFSFERFEKYFFPQTNNTTLFTFTQSVIDDLIAEDRIGSALTYRGTLNALKKFRKGKDVTFRDIDSTFLQEFKKHMRLTNGVNSVGIYFRTLKAIHKRAEKRGLANPELSPWNGYKIETSATRKRSLTKDQIEALKNYKTEKGSSQWHSLNYFLFSYLLRGMNFEDIARLSQDNIRNDRIFYTRQKTGDAFDVNIDSKVAEILLYFTMVSEHFIFPILSPGLSALTTKYRIKTALKRVNKDLQNIAESVNRQPENIAKGIVIPRDITFYWARHTAATVLKRAGVSTSMISEILGHSSEKVTKVYLDSFEKNELDKISELL